MTIFKYWSKKDFWSKFVQGGERMVKAPKKWAVPEFLRSLNPIEEIFFDLGYQFSSFFSLFTSFLFYLSCLFLSTFFLLISPYIIFLFRFFFLSHSHFESYIIFCSCIYIFEIWSFFITKKYVFCFDR